ncbi:MAG: GTPase Era [Thermoflexales bacterium]
MTTNEPQVDRQSADTPTPDSEAQAVSRSGFIAVVGKPNVGKSTLVNALIGHKVAIVSPKPQTTRRRILGVLTRSDVQMVFMDTPGIHQPKRALSHYMMREVETALKDCDVVLFVVELHRPPDEDDRRVAKRIAGLKQPKLMALNKSDLVEPQQVQEHITAHTSLIGAELPPLTELSGPARPAATYALPISSTRGDNLDKLFALLVQRLPVGPAYYPAGQYTDQPQQLLAAEFIREQALHFLDEEVPHSIAVVVDDWQERPNGVQYISATIFVERESQKGILIGKGGNMLKQIGAHARAAIEHELGRRVFLELWVKVRDDWRKDETWVRRLMSLE